MGKCTIPEPAAAALQQASETIAQAPLKPACDHDTDTIDLAREQHRVGPALRGSTHQQIHDLTLLAQHRNGLLALRQNGPGPEQILTRHSEQDTKPTANHPHRDHRQHRSRARMRALKTLHEGDELVMRDTADIHAHSIARATIELQKPAATNET